VCVWQVTVTDTVADTVDNVVGSMTVCNVLLLDQLSHTYYAYNFIQLVLLLDVLSSESDLMIRLVQYPFIRPYLSVCYISL